ncbi:MAG TPA: RHS repeat-associated core domain-containing protein, partial [Anaerolineae bacterium]|nr:RHS repeat-associated core domain-containing protein [Anaerolineae bacterium]
IDYTVNELNQYVSEGGRSWAYDTNGNRIWDGSHFYVYDAFDRLVGRSHRWETHLPLVVGGGGEGQGGAASTARLSIPASEIAYTFDGVDRQVTVQSDSGSVRYLYSGPQVIEERDGASKLLARYLPGLAMDRGTGWTYYHTDGLGNVRSVVDPSGAIVERVEYEAFGVPVFSDGATSSRAGNPYLFKGQRYDAMSGLYLYGTRRYDPEVGRYVQMGAGALGNPYAYEANNPVRQLPR